VSTHSIQAAGPTIGDVGGRSVVLAYGSVSAEYEALHHRAALFDRSHRGRLRVKGARAAEMVTGLVTNDVAALVPGQGCYAAALTAKGKIVADVRVFVEEDDVLVDAPPRAAAAWAAMVRKFVNPRIAPHADETASLRDIGVFGATARHVVSEMTGVPAPALAALAPYSHMSVDVDGVSIRIVRVPELEVEGFELLVPADSFTSLWTSAGAAGATPAGLEAWDIARVEAGRPEWGVDMDDNTIPQEANFDALHAISYTKGCYVGQETVARVHFRGHVNRHLRGLRAAGVEPIHSGATVHDESGAQVGDVRSTVRSPRLGAIALAMIRREIEPGAALIARSPGEGEGSPPIDRRVDVAALPFSV
jgi:folate-binding protein YgfZ